MNLARVSPLMFFTAFFYAPQIVWCHCDSVLFTEGFMCVNGDGFIAGELVFLGFFFLLFYRSVVLICVLYGFNSLSLVSLLR